MNQPAAPALSLQEQIDHLQGQVIGLRQLVLTLAQLSYEVDTLRDAGPGSIQRARDALLAQTVSEATLTGIDLTEQWLLHATDVR